MRSIDDLTRVPLIHFDWKRAQPENPTWERWLAAAGVEGASSAGQLRFSDEGHAIQAAVAGHGIALVSQALIAEELAAGHLIQPFGPVIAGHTYHLAVSNERSPSASAQAAMAWLKSQALAT